MHLLGWFFISVIPASVTKREGHGENQGTENQ